MAKTKMQKAIARGLHAIFIAIGLSGCASHPDEATNALHDMRPTDEIVQKKERKLAKLSASSSSGMAPGSSTDRTSIPNAAATSVNGSESKSVIPQPAPSFDETRQPAIVAASASGNVKLIRSLLASGAEVDARSPDSGGTALHYASYFRQLEAVRLLISSGADINAKDYETGFTPLMQATIRGNIEVARYLLSKGADVNATANSGNTAIMLAAIPSLRVPPDLVRLLIDNGADLGIRNEFGYNVSDIAENFSNTEFSELLRSSK
jgi:ankyrin repeat protein